MSSVQTVRTSLRPDVSSSFANSLVSFLFRSSLVGAQRDRD